MNETLHTAHAGTLHNGGQRRRRHKLARAQAREPADMADDKDFTIEETRNAVTSMDKKKAPGKDGITGEIYKSTFEIFPRYITHRRKMTSGTAVISGRNVGTTV
jgi:hypothetical protein